MASVDLSGRVALVTGGGAGLGRAYALNLASSGASVVVNDMAKDNAESVVKEIIAMGGKAVANTDAITKDLSSAEAIVQSAIKEFGKIDIIVNNAGVLRDASFAKQTEQQWDQIQALHLYGQRNICKAAWPNMVTNGYGRIVNIGSINGMRGAFGQTNYSAAKAAIVGFTKALAMEGAKRNIKVNVAIPVGGTAMTQTVMPEGLVKLLKPELAAPMVGFLCSDHESVPSGSILEAGAGYYAEWQWRRAEGVFLDITKPISSNDIAKNWGTITDMKQATDPIEDDAKVPKQSRRAMEIYEKQSKL